MNCKPGDIAIVQRNCRTKENAGAWVEVVRELIPNECLPGHLTPYRNDDEFAWVVSSLGRKIRTGEGLREFAALRDCCLRPIRPDETNEESLEAMRLLTHIPTKETV